MCIIILISFYLRAPAWSPIQDVSTGGGTGNSDGGGGDITNDGQRLLQGLVGPQHLVPPLGLLLRLVHQGILVPCRVQLGQ